MKRLFSRRGLLLSGMALSLLATAAGLFSLSGKSNAAPRKPPPVFVEIETLVANLQPEDGQHVLQVRCTAQLRSQAEAALFKEYMPEVHHRMLLLMSEKKPSEISNQAGKKRLLEEMLAELNQPYKTSGKAIEVRGLYLTTFVID